MLYKKSLHSGALMCQFRIAVREENDPQGQPQGQQTRWLKGIERLHRVSSAIQSGISRSAPSHLSRNAMPSVAAALSTFRYNPYGINRDAMTAKAMNVEIVDGA